MNTLRDIIQHLNVIEGNLQRRRTSKETLEWFDYIIKLLEKYDKSVNFKHEIFKLEDYLPTYKVSDPIT